MRFSCSRQNSRQHTYTCFPHIFHIYRAQTHKKKYTARLESLSHILPPPPAPEYMSRERSMKEILATAYIYALRLSSPVSPPSLKVLFVYAQLIFHAAKLMIAYMAAFSCCLLMFSNRVGATLLSHAACYFKVICLYMRVSCCIFYIFLSVSERILQPRPTCYLMRHATQRIDIHDEIITPPSSHSRGKAAVRKSACYQSRQWPTYKYIYICPHFFCNAKVFQHISLWCLFHLYIFVVEDNVTCFVSLFLHACHTHLACYQSALLSHIFVIWHIHRHETKWYIRISSYIQRNGFPLLLPRSSIYIIMRVSEELQKHDRKSQPSTA